METVQECFGWAGTGITVLSFLFPVFPYINVLKGKLDFESTPAVLVTTCYVNYFCWYIYGDMIFSDQIKYCYMIGGIVNLVLMIIYLAYEVKKFLVDSILNTLILITGTWAVYRALTIIIDDDRIIGKICIGTTLVVYLSPMQVLYKVIKEKNYMFIPIRSAWVYLLACIGWIAYGIFITDFYLICPHVAGVILSLIQIVIFYNYKRKFPAIGEKDFSSTIGIEKTGNEDTKNEETSIKIDEEESQSKAKEKPVKIVSKNDA